MKKILFLLLVFSLLMAPTSVWAKPKDKASKDGAIEKAGKKITEEVVKAVTNELTGKETTITTTSKDLPPGLAKKGKVPPGWDKGHKEGWAKSEKTEAKNPSLIEKWVGALFKKG